jgi:hypothetical protein
MTVLWNNKEVDEKPQFMGLIQVFSNGFRLFSELGSSVRHQV